MCVNSTIQYYIIHPLYLLCSSPFMRYFVAASMSSTPSVNQVPPHLKVKTE